jgi:hypothetical protein
MEDASARVSGLSAEHKPPTWYASTRSRGYQCAHGAEQSARHSHRGRAGTEVEHDGKW